MYHGPFLRQIQSPARQLALDYGQGLDVDRSFELTVASVKVRRRVIVEEHSNQDPVKRADRRHLVRAILPPRKNYLAQIGGGIIETVPQVIETDAHYRQIARRLGDLAGKGRARSAGETKLLRLLAPLVEDYDRQHAFPPDNSTPAERLQFLLEHAGKTAADLQPVFGQRSHVHEALTGKRGISAPQARKLGQLFRVSPGLFL
jgi:HTH-type transcriptional regulator/antitoxin HigA